MKHAPLGVNASLAVALVGTLALAANITVNAAPTVTLTKPVEGSVFANPAAIRVEATASSSDGSITSVKFDYMDYWMGCDGSEIIVTTPPYTAVIYPNISICGPDNSGGVTHTYYVSATAVDNKGATANSGWATIYVTETDVPPTVSLTSPAQNATFTAPASITLQAQAADSDGSVSSVAFYNGNTLITTLTSAPYSFTWTSVPQGGYTLTARATDNSGVSTTSSAVHVTVNAGVTQLYFIEVDHLNTPRLVANQLGQAVWRWYQQEPFGVNVPDENPSGLGAFEFSLRFPGQYFDKETNLHYNYFRDYDPQTGRYAQYDPLGFASGSDSYAYANSDPLQLVDPLGLAACKGSWIRNSWKTDEPGWFSFGKSKMCTCLWDCRTCDGSPEFSETSRGTLVYDPSRFCYSPRTRAWGPCRPGYINECRCEKPGPETRCACTI